MLYLGTSRHKVVHCSLCGWLSEESALTSLPPLPPIFYLKMTRLPDSNFSQHGIYVNWMLRFTKINDSRNFFPDECDFEYNEILQRQKEVLFNLLVALKFI